MVLYLPRKHRTGCKTKLTLMRNTNLSDLLKSALAGITLISEEHRWQFFLHIVLWCLANHKMYVYGYSEMNSLGLWLVKWILFIFAKYIFISVENDTMSIPLSKLLVITVIILYTFVRYHIISCCLYGYVGSHLVTFLKQSRWKNND